MQRIKHSQSSDLNFFNLSFSSVLVLLLAFGLASVGWKLAVASLFSAAALGLGWLIYLEKVSARFSWVGLLLFFVQLFISLMPFKPGNPFYVFDLQFFGSLSFMLASLPTYIGLAFESQFPNLKTWLCRWLPLVFLMATNAYFVVFDFHEVYASDHSRHIGNAVHIYDLLTGDQSGKLWQALTYYDFYQPIAYLSAAPFFWLFGKSYTVACLSLICFWLPLAYIFSRKTLLEYWKATESQATAITLMVVGGVMAVSMLKQFMQDFPVLALVSVYQYLVYRSSFFLRSKASAWAALVFGIGLLTKASFLLYGAGPWFLAIYRAWRNGKLPLLFINLLSFTGIISLTAGIWFLVNRSHYNYTLPAIQDFAGPMNLPTVDTWESFFWYWPKLVYILSEPLFILALVGLGLLLLQKKKRTYLLLNSLICFLLVFISATFVRNKDARTLLPIVAFFVPLFLIALQRKEFQVGKVLMVFGLLWILALNLNLGTGLSNPITSLIHPKAYFIENEPAVPYSDAPNKSYYVYQKLFHEHFTDSAAPALSIGQDVNSFTDRYFLSLYKAEPQLNERTTLGTQKLFFLRDHYWQDHYLFSLAKDSGGLCLQSLGSVAEIGGDIFCTLKCLDSAGNELNTKVIELKPGESQWKTKIASSTSRLSISFKVHHIWPSGQFVQITYALFGDNSYQPMFVPLEIFEPNSSRVADKILDINSL